MKHWIMIAAAAFALAGCEARINTSSPEKFTKSVAAVTKDLSPADKEAFNESMIAIAFDTGDPKSMGAFSPDVGNPMFLAALQEKVKGKNAKSVIKLGYETRIRKFDEQLAKTMGEVQQAKAERAKYQATFDAFTITNPRYYLNRSMFMDEPTIAFTITNGTKTAIKRGYFHGKLTSPGRTVPWVDDDFNYEFVGGLEPGETKSLNLAPNMFGPWGNKEFGNRSDLKMQVTLVNLEDAQGQKLLDGDPEETAIKEREMLEVQKLKKDLQSKLDSM